MSFEAIASIAQAEAEAKATVAGAQARARQLVDEAEAAGKAAIEAAEAKAESELGELRRQSDEKARADARGLSGELETTRAVLRAKAEARLDEAASLVVERIVKS